MWGNCSSSLWAYLEVKDRNQCQLELETYKIEIQVVLSIY